MELNFNEEQIILRQTAESVCKNYADLSSLREIEGTELGYSEDFWKQLVELGLTGISIPEEFGGSNMGLLDSAILYEEFGKALALSPLFISSFMCASLVESFATKAQKDIILPNIASGADIYTLGLLEKNSSFHESGINLEIQNKANSLVLNGSKQMVPYASVAKEIIVICKYKNSIVAAIVPMDQADVIHSYQANHAKTSMYEVEFNNVKIDDSMLLIHENFWSVWELISQKCQILIAAEAAGGSEKSLYLGRDYSLEREAFGQKIGSFQSIAHYLADGLVEVEASKLMTYQAAWAYDNQRDISSLSAMAKLQACKSYREISATTIQIFGGMGFTVDADPQLYFRRAKHLQNSLWGETYLEQQLESAFFNKTRKSD